MYIQPSQIYSNISSLHNVGKNEWIFQWTKGQLALLWKFWCYFNVHQNAMCLLCDTQITVISENKLTGDTETTWKI